VFAGTFGDYNQLAIQFGYVTLFAPTYPMVVVLAFLSNLVEIRSDAYKLCGSFQRPNPNECESIGTWFEIFLAMSFFAVSTTLAAGSRMAGRVGSGAQTMQREEQCIDLELERVCV